MKNIKFAFIALSAAALLSGCNNFLTVESPSQFDTNWVFSNENDALKVLLGAYEEFDQDPFSSRMANVWAQNTDVECIAPAASPDGSRRDVWSLQAGLLETFGDVKKAWDSNYLAIDRANQVIEGLEGTENASLQLIQAEAYTLRAYRYWMLCCMWGDVPYFQKSAKAGMELDLPKTDKNVIFTKELQALVDHEKYLKFSDVAPAGIERMNRDFCLGLIARIALFRAGYGMTADGTMKRADDYLDVHGEDLTVTYSIGGSSKTASTSADYFQMAKDYCQYLISLKDRPLVADYENMFHRQCELYTNPGEEVLFEVAHVSGNGGDVGWCIGQTYNGPKGSTTIQVNLSPAYYLSFDDEDIRRDATCTLVKWTGNYQEIMSPTAICVGKWSRAYFNFEPGESSSKGTGVNWTLMRYSDVLLMLAEAENELNGPTDLAKSMLKRVRQRAFPASARTEKVEAYVNSLSDKDEFRKAIVDERAWEFGGEALRKYDLVRWNIYDDKIKETVDFLIKLGRASVDNLVAAEPELEPYTKYAKKLYYTRENGVIKFLNTKYEPAPADIPESIISSSSAEWTALDWNGAYASTNFAAAFREAVKEKIDGVETETGEYNPATYIQYCYRGYYKWTGGSYGFVEAMPEVPYLIPIGGETVANSEYLNNKGYGHVTSAN